MSKLIPIIFSIILFSISVLSGCFDQTPPPAPDYAKKLYGTWLKNPGTSSVAVRWSFYENKTLIIQTSRGDLVCNETLEFYVRTVSYFCMVRQNGTENCFFFDFSNEDKFLWLTDAQNKTYQFIRN